MSALNPTVSIIAGQEDINGQNDAVPGTSRQAYEKRGPATYEKNLSRERNAGAGIFKSKIQQFYSRKTILITGGSGFLGKVLIEKLLRTCTDITTIYILIREKNEENIEDRLNNIFWNVIFDRLKEEVPNFREKIVPIKGDLCVEKLGLSEHNENLLRQQVSIVFHIGGTTCYNKELKTSAMINVNATKYLLNMAKNMKNLKAFIHMSTLYANCHLEHNEEIFYPCPMSHRDFLTIAKTNNRIEECCPKLMVAASFSEWPNMYTITKAVAESLLRDASEELPIGIFRPGIVISANTEPLVGWIDNYPVGVVGSYYKGLIKHIPCNSKCTANLVPVDKTVNALIVAAWDVSTKPERRGIETLIYNYVSSNDTPVRWGQYFHAAQELAKEYPLKKLPNITFIKDKHLYKSRIVFDDIFSMLKNKFNQNTYERSWPKLEDKIHQSMESLEYFGMREWTYANYNVQSMWHRLDRKDQRLFNFDMERFNWQDYLRNHFKGIFLHLFQENVDNFKNQKKEKK